ncbi:MAG: diaminopimelate epimerase [Pseudomonadota bacterium]
MDGPTPQTGLRFMKMHGLGNDFVVIDSRGREPLMTRELAAALGDRHHGVGFDQLAEITDHDSTDIGLAFWNSDGSKAAACGNATRCVSEFILSETGADHLTLTTPRGLLEATRDRRMISVNMGQPQLAWDEIPLAEDMDPTHLPIDGDPMAVGMGNPHCVFFVDDAETAPVDTLGPKIETHPLFPERTNVEFAQIRARDDIRMRVWERGTGITLACGSGACATLVAAHARGLTDARVRMEVDGGWLIIEQREDGIWMTGPTMHVFDGILTEDFLGSL